MKILFIFFIGFFLLSSCQWQKPITLEEKKIEVNTQAENKDTLEFSDLVKNIASKFKDNQNYVQCLSRAADSCMNETQIWENIAWTWSIFKLSCDDYILDESRESCKQQEILHQAKEKNDVSICESLSNGTVDSCQYEVIIAQTSMDSNISVCDQLKEAYVAMCKKRIITQKASISKNIKLCDSLVDISSISATGAEAEFLQEDMKIERDMCKQEVEMRIEIEKELELEKEKIENSSL